MVAHFAYVLFLYAWYDDAGKTVEGNREEHNKHSWRRRFCKVFFGSFWWKLAVVFCDGLNSFHKVLKKRNVEDFPYGDEGENDIKLRKGRKSTAVRNGRPQLMGEEEKSLSQMEEGNTATKEERCLSRHQIGTLDCKNAKMSKDQLLAKDMYRRLTASMLVTSSAADADLALDWVFAMELLRRSTETPPDGVLFIPDKFFNLSVVFSAIGTVLWVLSSFDISGFVGPAAPFGYEQPNNHPFWCLPWTRAMVVFVTVLLEDIPQLAITIVVLQKYDASTLTSYALANIVTSAYAFALKLVQMFVEQGSHEIDIPTTVNMANTLERNHLLGEFESLLDARDNVNLEIDAAISKCYRGMQELDLSYEKVNDYRIQKLAETLITINLQGSSIGDNGVATLARSLEINSTLQHLRLGRNSIGDAGAKALARSLETNLALQHLDLDYNSIGHDGAKALAEALETNATLQHLDLGRNYIGDAGARALARSLETNYTLQHLHFDEHCIATPVKNKTALQHLHLGVNSIGDAGAMALARSLETYSALLQLDLFGNYIGPDGAMALARSLKTNYVLQHLDLGRNSIGDAGAKALARSLEKNLALRHLDLFGNSIGPDGAMALARSLKTQLALQHLDLGRNSIGDAGANGLARSLETNLTLQHLALDENSIGHDGAADLARSLKTQLVLQHLDLVQNFIGDPGAKALAEALETNSTLQHLDLRMNYIGDAGTAALSRSLETNSVLQYLGLGGNSFGEDAFWAISVDTRITI